MGVKGLMNFFQSLAFAESNTQISIIDKTNITQLLCYISFTNYFLFIEQRRNHHQRRKRESVLLCLSLQMRGVAQTGMVWNTNFKF